VARPRPGHGERPHAAGGDEMWRIPAHRSGAQWSALQLEIAAIRGIGRTRAARLRYEDFVASPVGSLISATARLGLPLTADELPRVDDGRVLLEPSHGLSGNPGRFSSGVHELRRDDGWAAQMPALDRAVVTALTLPLLRAYGYPATSRSVVSAPSPRQEQRSHS